MTDLLIAFFVNDIEREYENFTTTTLAHRASTRGDRVCYITPSDFVLSPDDSLSAHGRFLPERKFKDRADFFKALKSDEQCTLKRLDMTKIDVLMLRNDPSIDLERPWAMEAGILFGREAAKRGVIVLNDPDSLAKAVNKLYFQNFPPETRAETLITKHSADIKAFAKEHKSNIILKPLQGSGGANVFKLDPKNSSNLNQIIEAIGRDGYIIAQAYVRAAEEGDIRLFMMNGDPLQKDGKYAAMRRVAAEGDIRANVHAGAKRRPASIGKTQLEIAEMIRPKLIADGMFLVGVDIVGDKVLEVNVFSPGNLEGCSDMVGVDFSVPVLEAIERKVTIARHYRGRFDNRHLAVL